MDVLKVAEHVYWEWLSLAATACANSCADELLEGGWSRDRIEERAADVAAAARVSCAEALKGSPKVFVDNLKAGLEANQAREEFLRPFIEGGKAAAASLLAAEGGAA